VDAVAAVAFGGGQLRRIDARGDGERAGAVAEGGVNADGVDVDGRGAERHAAGGPLEAGRDAMSSLWNGRMLVPDDDRRIGRSAMTLTAELADANSPASRLLRDLFPAIDILTGEWNFRVQELGPVVTGLTGGNRATVGSAIEWCIGLSLADAVPYADVFELIPRDEAARILREAGLQPSSDGLTGSSDLGAWHRPALGTPAEAAPGLLRASWMLCQYAGLLRRAGVSDPDQWRQSYPMWLSMFDGTLASDSEQALRMLWHTYVTRGHSALAQLGGPCVIRPVFDDAFAVGDLVLGGTLVDVKAYLDPGPSIGAFVDQLLGYVLCDIEDRFRIRAIGVYLAWQGELLQLPLDEALALASGQARFDVMAARRAFQQQIAPALEVSRFYKYRGAVPAPEGDA
jgi:hypothetical protein